MSGYRPYAAAAILFAIFALLGTFVHGATPTLDDTAGALLGGRGSATAWFFTWLGYTPALVIGGVALGLAAWRRAIAPAIALWLYAAQFLSQGLVEVLKHLFARARPALWYVHHEPGFSYPSGHATTAALFYGAMLVLLVRSAASRPVKLAGGAILAIAIAGIGASRIALGAHHLTDVLGGYAFGAAFAFLWSTRLPAAASARSTAASP